MLVGELMTRSVESVGERAPLGVALRLLDGRHVSALPVVDESHRVVGIVSEADVLALHTESDPRSRLRPPRPPQPWPDTVGEVMTPDPVVAHEGSDVGYVARLMADTGWKSMPVVDGDGVLVGMVSRSDVIRVLATADDQIRRRIAHDYAQLTDRQWTVEVTDGLVTVRGVTSERDGRLASAIAATAPGVRRVVVDASTLGAPLSP